VRKGIIRAILATDMKVHFELGAKFTELVEEMGENTEYVFDDDDTVAKELMCKGIVHAADLANACQPFDQALPWAQRVVLEFHNQAQSERDMGLTPAPFMDTSPDDLDAVYKLQCGFIRFIVEPYWEPLTKLFPTLQQHTAVLKENLAIYEQGAPRPSKNHRESKNSLKIRSKNQA
jgi:hypothetical protein